MKKSHDKKTFKQIQRLQKQQYYNIVYVWNIQCSNNIDLSWFVLFENALRSNCKYYETTAESCIKKWRD